MGKSLLNLLFSYLGDQNEIKTSLENETLSGYFSKTVLSLIHKDGLLWEYLCQ